MMSDGELVAHVLVSFAISKLETGQKLILDALRDSTDCIKITSNHVSMEWNRQFDWSKQSSRGGDLKWCFVRS